MPSPSLVILGTLLMALAPGEDAKPFPGVESRWEGFVRHDFQVNEANVIVVEPKKPLPGRPWAWRGEFFGAFPNADIELLKRGWHLAYIGVPDLFGSPKAMKHWEKFYDVMVKDHGLSPKPALIGLSRGALYCMAWAATHPDKTLLVYLDNGVCDFKSWPGGKPKGLGSGQGSPEEWLKLLRAYDFKDDREAIASKVNPVDNLAPLAKAGIPILLIYGDTDKAVPHKENSEVVYDRYKALGGHVERIIKPGQDHHPHGLTDPRPIVEFFERVRRKARHFRMGFTGFPHDFSIEAVVDARQFSRQNADIIAHHIEGVPWAELLANKPFSDELINEWKGKKEATPEGGKVYLAISPGRGDLKPGEKSLPFPKELVGKSYDDPVVMKAYLGYCRRMVGFFKPDYLGIGIEVNEIYQAGPDKWRAYAALHRHVYQELKKDHPDLPIFASFTLHGMLNQTGRKREAMLTAFREVMPFNDLVAVSFYPFIRGGTTDIDGCLRWLTDHFDGYKKPYAFVEVGEPAERLRIPSSGQIIDGTPQKQAAFYETLLAFARDHEVRFVISFLHRDYDALWEKIKGSSPEAFMVWRDCGLLDQDGKARPAYTVWKRYFEVRLAR